MICLQSIPRIFKSLFLGFVGGDRQSINVSIRDVIICSLLIVQSVYMGLYIKVL